MHRTLHRVLLTAAFLVAGSAAQAQAAGDPLKSPECARARDSLEAARAASQPAARVEALRRDAARICLGAGGDALPPARVAQPPLHVPPTRITPAVRPTAPSLPLAPPAAPLPEIRRPGAVTNCDAGGCWDSNGTRLNRAGPNLVTPGGSLCTQQGSLVNCP